MDGLAREARSNKRFDRSGGSKFRMIPPIPLRRPVNRSVMRLGERC